MILKEKVSADLGRDSVVEVARTHLYWLFGEGAAVETNLLQGDVLPRVNVTLRTNGAIRGSMSGIGDSFRAQILDAVYRASRDSRFSGSIVRADLKNVSIEVWLQLSAELIPLEERESANIIQMGRDGLEVESGTAFAYYKPSVALTSHFTTPQEMFSALCKKANLPDDAWKGANCQLRRSSWVHFCETEIGKTIEFRALRTSRYLEITKDTMVDWAEHGVSYLKENQYSDGSFCYQYRPFQNSAKRGPTNPVRASGCAYAIAAAASSSHLVSNQGTTRSAMQAVTAILSRQKPLGDGGIFITDNLAGPVGGKLGTTALLLLALMTPDQHQTYEQEIGKLITAIKSAQSDNGLFECSFGEGDKSDSQINFFPGQALLALVRRTEQGDMSCREYFQRAFVPYREHFRRYPATAFVGWQADAWSRAALLDTNNEYAEFVFDQIDWLLQFQIHDDTDSMISGGFSWNGKPPNYSSIVYTEAIARGADLAYKLGEPRWRRYKEAFRAGVQFCSNLRLTEEQSIFFPHPSRAIGGMATSLSNFEIRSDVVQHSITLALSVLERPVLWDS